MIGSTMFVYDWYFIMSLVILDFFRRSPDYFFDGR